MLIVVLSEALVYPEQVFAGLDKSCLLLVHFCVLFAVVADSDGH